MLGLLAGLSLPLANTWAAPLVMVFQTLPPWLATDADGRPSGPYLDFASEIARRMGVPLEVRVCPVRRCLAMLERGEADIVLGFTPTEERRRVIEFLDPPFAPPAVMAFFVSRGDTRPLRNYGDLRSRHIGVVDSVRYFPRFDEDTQLAKDSAPDSPSNMQKLAAGRVDSAIFNRAEAWWLIRRHHLEGRIVETPYHIELSVPRYVGLSRRSSFMAHKSRLSAVLRAMTLEGFGAKVLAPIEGRSHP
ncbi:substrate-binding periplasmic protein [Paludibacterium paludis]|uniref:Solute-binding protein family 3/N-terminal domain-containing protein n=1 Tax=Paludibacterium paludis TaxID=1225769 RepID=A0A918P073_9NEIS|nr:transporter substrate-binding domain-containing protein [Paludibacterium paludis]GGY08946.1 hypothetical protein GCM10011289_09520 [Paludibacterium paludis]